MSDISTKKLFMIINSLECGGAERVFSIVLRQMVEMGVNVHLILLDDSEIFYKLPDGIKMHNLNTDNIIKAAVKLLKLASIYKPDVMLSFLHRSNYINVICHLLYRKYYCVISERTYTSKRFASGMKSMVNRMMIKILYPRCNSIIVVSDDIKIDLRKNYGIEKKVHSIANPYDISSIIKMANDNNIVVGKKYICYVGRLEPVKSVETLIGAYIDSNLDEDLVIVGTGTQEKDLKALAFSSDKSDKIHFVGQQDNPFPIVKHSTCFVLSSLYEGFPNAMVEAMCLGIPIIASDCASGPGTILGGSALNHNAVLAKYGVLFPVSNKDALKNALEMVCHNSDLQAKLKELSIKRSKEYSVEKITHAYQQIIFRRCSK